MIQYTKGSDQSERWTMKKVDKGKNANENQELKLLPAFVLSNNKHNRTPSISTMATEKSTKSNKSWRLPRINSTGNISAKLGKMGSKQSKSKVDEIPAVPALPKSAFLMTKKGGGGGINSKKTNQKEKLEDPSTSQIDFSSSLRSDQTDLLNSDAPDPILKPPTPAFLGFKQRRASARSSVTSNSESGSEFGSERSVSTYTTSTAHSPIYFNANPSPNHNQNQKLSSFPSQTFIGSQERANESKSKIKDAIKLFGRRTKNQNSEKIDRSPSQVKLNLSQEVNPITPVIRASCSAPQLHLGIHSTDFDPFRSAPLHLPDSLPLINNEIGNAKSEDENRKSSFSLEVQRILGFENEINQSTGTSQSSTSPLFRATKRIFQTGTFKLDKNNRISNVQSIGSDDEYGTDENVSHVTPLPTPLQSVKKISPGQSPMLSPTTLLPPTPPLTPLKNNIGLITSSRKALYTCTVRKLHPHLNSNVEGQSNILQSPRSVNRIELLQTHPSTTGHIRSLPILLARTRVARRLKNTCLNQNQEDEIFAFVEKGYLESYLSPKEVVSKIMQRTNTNVQAEALARPPLQNNISSNSPNGMAIWVNRPPFKKRMRNIVFEENEFGNAILKEKAIGSTFSEPLKISDRCKVLSGMKEREGMNDCLPIKNFGNLGPHSRSKDSQNNYSQFSQTLEYASKDDDIPLALLRSRRSDVSRSPVDSNYTLFVRGLSEKRSSSIISNTKEEEILLAVKRQREEKLRQLEDNKRLISEARQRRQQQEHPSLGKPFLSTVEENRKHIQSISTNKKIDKRYSNLNLSDSSANLSNTSRMMSKNLTFIDEEDESISNPSGRRQRKPSLSTPPIFTSTPNIHPSLFSPFHPIEVNNYGLQTHQNCMQTWQKPQNLNPFYNFPHIGPMMYPNSTQQWNSIALQQNSRLTPTTSNSSITSQTSSNSFGHSPDRSLRSNQINTSSNLSPKRSLAMIHSHSDTNVNLRSQVPLNHSTRSSRQLGIAKADMTNDNQKYAFYSSSRRSPLSQNVYNA